MEALIGIVPTLAILLAVAIFSSSLILKIFTILFGGFGKIVFLFACIGSVFIALLVMGLMLYFL